MIPLDAVRLQKSYGVRAKQKHFFSLASNFFLIKVTVGTRMHFSLDFFFQAPKCRLKQNDLYFTYWQKEEKKNLLSLLDKIFHSGSLIWWTNLNYSIINAFLLRATQMWLQPVSYLAKSVKKLCSNFHIFLHASLHSASFQNVPVTGLMT